jgi:peptidyl-prolyl cis-trans isomerase C
MALFVNEEFVSDQAIGEQYMLLAQAYPGTSDAALQQQLQHVAEENAVFHAILNQQAAKAGFTVTAQDISAQLANRRGTSQSSVCSASENASIEREIKVERFIQTVTRNVPRATSRELDAIYQQTRERFQQPEQLHVRQIIKNVNEFASQAEAAQAMQAAQQALRSGRRFEKVADEFSDCRGNGGDLGWIARNEMVPEFEEVVFNMRAGQTSDIFATRFGLHIATLVARRAPRTLPFAEVRGYLAQEAAEARRQNALVLYLRQEAQRADIRVVRA